MQEMIRALFIFAKLNPGLTYIQGMNELLAPLYYTFSTDTDSGTAAHAEADAFYCFIDLISEFRDNFCQSLVGARLHACSADGPQSILHHVCGGDK